MNIYLRVYEHWTPQKLKKKKLIKMSLKNIRKIALRYTFEIKYQSVVDDIFKIFFLWFYIVCIYDYVLYIFFSNVSISLGCRSSVSGV